MLFLSFSLMGQEMFDDFNYTGPGDPEISKFSWIIRSGGGGPGPSGCTWSKNNVSFVSDSTGNMSMRMKASTGGTAGSTSQCEVYTPREYLAGTYAARIRFTDTTFTGITKGDQINETFFTISPLNFSLDPDYSEVDFVEYLPNGGWGVSGSTYWMTTWETYQGDPWIQQSKSNRISKSFQGWHIVACIIDAGTVKYYIDGALKATHGGIYYPESMMSINFNLWYIANGLVTSSTNPRSYVEDIDWVFHAKDSVVDPQNLPDLIDNFRSQSILSKKLNGQIRYGTIPDYISPEILHEKDVSIFQDSVSETLTIKIKEGEKALISIYSIDGRLLFKTWTSEEINTIDIINLGTKGIVIANVSTKNSSYSFKVVIK